MFAAETTDVDPEMVNHTMTKLTNLTTGQIKSIPQLTNSPRLPMNIGSPNVVKRPGSASNAWEHFPLRAGQAKILVSLTTQTSVAEEYVK
ncbi:MAG: hypothetical protein VYA34_15765 [Myxococcota bacterium]|nr:hypothetical protein [Myxococcota bacterium]